MKDSITNEKSFGRTVLSLVLPLAIQNLINVAVNGADVFMLQMIGETSLSAASMAGQVYFILTLILFGMSSGAAVLTAQYWGKRDVRTVEKVMGMTVRFAVTVSMVFFIVAFCFPRAVMSVLTDVPAVIDEGVPYLRIMACSYPITAVTIICLNVLRTIEKVNISTVVYLLSLFTNIGLNLCFIKGWIGFPRIGIAGVAIATVSARALEIVITLIYVRSRKSLMRLRFKDIFKRNKLLSKDFLHYSMPVVLNEMLWGTAISLSATVIGHLGQEPIAAQSVATTVRQLAMVVVFGIANATAIIVGKEIGAGRVERAKTYSRKLMRFSLAAGICGAALMFGLRPVIPGLMGNLSELAAEYLKFMLLAMSVYVIFASVSATGIVGVFRAGGDTRMGLLLDVGTLWFICLPLGFLAAFVWNLDVKWVFLILVSDELLKFPIVIWRFRSMKWLNNVTRDEVTEQNKEEAYEGARTA
ncbi:MAG: MATE family efflux transporter [Clostridia bacterium]|nr:MATE family efflux transporter [Clostridia bacterium]